MDRLRKCMDALRVLAARSLDPPELTTLIEGRINEFIVGDERAALEELRKAIEREEAQKRKGEDWTIAREYVRAELKKLT
jgi:hypothetical protein